MKEGRSLQTIAAELERQINTRKDYLAPQAELTMITHDSPDKVHLQIGGPVSVGLTDHAHGQLGSHLGIPAAYYDKMLADEPALLADNVNVWLNRTPSEKRMVRTLDGKARAVLSAKFRPLDNYEVATAVLPVLQQKGVQVMSAELTETRMYIKGILPALSDPLPEGMAYGAGHNAIIAPANRKDGRLVAAIVISNSEVGAGSLRVEPSVFTTWCTNLAIIAEAAMRKYHVGKSFSADDNFEVFRDDTRRADDRAFFLKVRDVTLAAFDEHAFREAIASVRQAAETPIKSDNLPKVVEVAAKRLALPEGIQPNILAFLSTGGDLSQWGLSSAITMAANTHPDYEGATLLERAGGKVLALGPSEWKAIAEAA